MTTSQPLTADWSALPGRPCSVAAALQLLGEKWSLLAIREISYGNRRFVEIARNTGAPRDRLSVRLRSLEEAGIIERRQYLERPERFEYWLTESGRELTPVLHALLLWGDKWLAESPPVSFVHECGHELDVVTICRGCGEQTAKDDVTLKINVPGWTRSGPAE